MTGSNQRSIPLLTEEEMNQSHPVLNRSYADSLTEGAQVIYLAGGCFWGMEQVFWDIPGVLHTFVGYMGGTLPHPTYKEVCTGATGHAETVRVVYDPAVVGEGAEEILRVYWNNHNSTQLNRHYGDIGEQYRSEVWCVNGSQVKAAQRLKTELEKQLAQSGKQCFTVISKISQDPSVEEIFYPAEMSHQAYLHHQPYGYCTHQIQSVVI
ncbi:peptide-methionine (S)-S-oxide reductase MsrA [Actinomyces vulturis]|uniref:peptide-methionine (S)-S-oxide reductase MsrA n=1 Tax=Actinomyces vulturis TaxID=1857645 RepID=UPI00082A3241|nr:peptide-methionine (S)-S-oxide reductase MsrA [Actinomyces vulturis]